MSYKNTIMENFQGLSSRLARVIALAGVVWIASSVNPVSAQQFKDYTLTIPETSVEMDFVAVPGGTFLMGSDANEAGRNDNEGPQRAVQVDPFWMGKYEISWEQYNLFVEEEIPALTQKIEKKAGDLEIAADAVSLPTPPYVDMSFGMGREGYPAISMTNYAAMMYAKWLSAKTGEFYRLPTEAEWEYACRAGSDTPYHFGNSADSLDEYEWYAENSNRGYNQIGTKKPNAFGLHDMGGNVAEWTVDQYHEDYLERLEGDPAVNPKFIPEELYPRSVRGGSWMDDADQLRCAKRRGSEARWKMLDPQLPKSLWWHTSAQFLGFRLVRPEVRPSDEEIEKYWIEAMHDYF
ncbi:MAG TPA: SUMF1/EgtB/PvdO family nonheme iron enzyme [Balneolaceae bacterium]|nr:SUMF1/EgtB/PvdO family nonheme iron enzyme [Balneolaceae bacterium]